MVINELASNQGAAAADRERAGTHSNVAVRLDLIDPEAFINQGARSAEQFFELPKGERSHLHHSHSTLTPVFKQLADIYAIKMSHQKSINNYDYYSFCCRIDKPITRNRF